MSYGLLLVDDEPGAPDSISRHLAEAPPSRLAIRHAKTVAEARTALAATSVDAVLLWLNLLDSSGLSTVRSMVSASRGVPVIVLAGVVDDHLRRRAIAAGAEEVFAHSDARHRLFARSVLYVIERERARARHLRIEAMIELAPDAILVVSMAGIVRYVNRAALELFDRSHEDLLGEHVGFSIKDGEPLEIAIPHRDGERTCEIRVVPFTWQGTPALLGSIRDLTELKRSRQDALDKQRLAELRAGTLRSVLDEIAGLALRCGLPEVSLATASLSNAELDSFASSETINAALAAFEAAFRGNVDANAQLSTQNLVLVEAEAATAAANRDLDAFSSAVTRDLRARLRRIESFTTLLIAEHRHVLDEEVHQHLGRIRETTERIAQLMDNQLALARVSRAELHRVPVDLSRLVREVARRFLRRHPGCTAEILVADDLVAEVDHRLVELLFEQLLDNALKFTSQCTSPRIEVGKLQRDDDSVYFVRDNGVGLSTPQTHRLARIFERVRCAADYEGAGLGLRTVTRIVERHGGTISAAGGLGEGATFYFTLARPASRPSWFDARIMRDATSALARSAPPVAPVGDPPTTHASTPPHSRSPADDRLGGDPVE